MKKLVLTTVASTVLATTAVFAQPQKGDWMVGAGIANSQAYLSNRGYNQFQVSLLPSAGYFIGNRFAVGTGIGLGYAAGWRKQHYFHYSISPFARYYFARKEGIKIHRPVLFGEASISVGGRSIVDKTINYRQTNSTGNVGVGVGLAYFITPNVSVEGLLKLYTQDLYYKPNNGIIPSLSIGFNIYLKGKKRKAEVVK